MLSHNFETQGQCANLNRKPVVFDPVGVGATSYRRNAANGSPKPLRLVLELGDNLSSR